MYKPAHAVAVVTKRLKKLEPADEESSILIGQRFESLDQTTGKKGRSDEFAEPSEFLTGVAYRGHIVVSNPTGPAASCRCLLATPRGQLAAFGQAK